MFDKHFDEESKIFEKLYKYDKNGNIKEWSIYVINKGNFSTINISYGVIDSKKVLCVREIHNGKNAGKKNQTNHFQQAVMESESKWKNKQEKENFQIGLDFTVLKIQKPMLAHSFIDYKSKIEFPCFIQPKFDGYRMIFNGEKCLTRQGKEYNILYNTELYKELFKIFEKHKIILDGELYLHGLDFENLGILRKKILKTESEKNLLNQIQFHVYDYIDKQKTFKERYNTLREIFKTDYKNVVISDTVEIMNENDLEKYHLEFQNKNFEGSILRNSTGLYVEGRSFNLLKYKNFQDSEYKIIDFDKEIDRQEQKNLVIWVCETKDGKKFNVRPKGTILERNEIYNKCLENFSQYKGHLLWVKFFEITKLGVPRFPTTKTCSANSYIRDVID